MKVEKEYLALHVRTLLSFFRDNPAVHSLCFVLDILREYREDQPGLEVLAWNSESILFGVRVADRHILAKAILGAVEILSVRDQGKKPMKIGVHDDSDTFEFLRTLIEEALA
ncbi:hypothetical protein [Hydrogenivirga sp.]